jgi:hypothetical protein
MNENPAISSTEPARGHGKNTPAPGGIKPFNCAVVGASGRVGRKFVEILEDRKTPVEH